MTDTYDEAMALADREVKSPLLAKAAGAALYAALAVARGELSPPPANVIARDVTATTKVVALDVTRRMSRNV